MATACRPRPPWISHSAALRAPSAPAETGAVSPPIACRRLADADKVRQLRANTTQNTKKSQHQVDSASRKKSRLQRMVIAKHGRGQVARGTRARRRPLSSYSSSMPLASLKKMLPSGLLAHVRRCAQGLAAEHAVAHLLQDKRQTTSRCERPAPRRGEPVGPPARRPPQTQLVPRRRERSNRRKSKQLKSQDTSPPNPSPL